jgi:hypothetical protein
MIDLATAAIVAAIVSNSATAIDKIYNWIKERQGGQPASVGLRNEPETKSLQYVSLTGRGQTYAGTMSYHDIAQKLSPEDVRHLKGYEDRMSAAMTQWDKLNARLPLADSVERASIEADMEFIRSRDVCYSLKNILDFIEQQLLFSLEDHYHEASFMCNKVD